ncbi:MAG: DUF924 domain-containing protein [Granulosicoccus sp.]|nr:DUF924 domain-containing protein [Granulosicoccus sp.]
MTRRIHHQADADQTPAAVLDFWFRDEATGRMDLPQGQRWFKGGKALDEQLEQRFAALLARGRDGQLDDWLQDAQGTLALIVLLDQFNRNIHRGTAEAFAADAQALAACLHALEQAYPAQLPLTQQVFCFLPLEHDESVASQERSVALFEALAAQAPPELQEFAQGTADFAREHKSIIDRFGRYPYRNAVLGRTSTPAELEWLAQSNTRFGQ